MNETDLTTAQRELLIRICNAATVIDLRGVEIRVGRALVERGFAIEMNGRAWQLLPTKAGSAKVAA